MLSVTTLAAFSSGISQAGFTQSDPAWRSRSATEQSSAPPTLSPVVPANPTPNQKLPRGSLLDLSV
jgi:hypothetical protein